MLSQAFAIGVTVGVFPLMLEPLESTFGATRTRISLGPVLIMLALAGAGLVAGSVLDRGEVRRAMLFGTGLMASGLALAGLATQLWMLGLAALVAGFSVPFIGPLAGMTIVSRLVPEDQGRAYGLLSMGPALGSGFFAALTGVLLPQLGWRGVYQLLAGLTLLVLGPLIGGWNPARADAPGDGSAEKAPPVALTEVMRRPVFWLSAGVFALAAGIATGWTNHFAAFLGGVGLSERQTAGLIAVQYWMGVPGALVFGVLADRLSLVALFVAMLGFEALAYVAYGSGPSPLTVALLGIGFGFMVGGLIPLYMMLLGRRLETQILGRAMGVSNLLMLPVMAAAALFAAGVYEREGSYDRATLIFGIGMLAAIASLLLAERSARRA